MSNEVYDSIKLEKSLMDLKIIGKNLVTICSGKPYAILILEGKNKFTGKTKDLAIKTEEGIKTLGQMRSILMEGLENAKKVLNGFSLFGGKQDKIASTVRLYIEDALGCVNVWDRDLPTKNKYTKNIQLEAVISQMATKLDKMKENLEQISRSLKRSKIIGSEISNKIKAIDDSNIVQEYEILLKEKSSDILELESLLDVFLIKIDNKIFSLKGSEEDRKKFLSDLTTKISILQNWSSSHCNMVQTVNKSMLNKQELKEFVIDLDKFSFDLKTMLASCRSISVSTDLYLIKRKIQELDLFKIEQSELLEDRTYANKYLDGILRDYREIRVHLQSGYVEEMEASWALGKRMLICNLHVIAKVGLDQLLKNPTKNNVTLLQRCLGLLEYQLGLKFANFDIKF